MAHRSRNPNWLLARDLQELTGLSRQTITDLCRAGVIRSEKGAGKRGWHRIRRQDATAFTELVADLRRKNREDRPC